MDDSGQPDEEELLSPGARRVALVMFGMLCAVPIREHEMVILTVCKWNRRWRENGERLLSAEWNQPVTVVVADDDES